MDSLVNRTKQPFGASTQHEPRPTHWDRFLQLPKQTTIPDDFLSQAERQQPFADKNPFAKWDEHANSFL